MGAVVRLSYEGLDVAAKAMFLDACTVMQGQSSEHALSVWQAQYETYKANLSWFSLLDRSLIKTSLRRSAGSVAHRAPVIVAHDIIRAQAAHIIKSTATEAGVRFWKPDQVRGRDVSLHKAS